MQRQQGSRIDLGGLKAQIVKNIGVERSRRYFYYLSRFMSQKLSKSDFDKSCYRVLGRENLPLHNQLIRSILKNASQAKTPPLFHEPGPAKSLVHPSREDRPEQNHNVPVWSNGVLPVSPRKVRSVIRDRKFRDRPSPLGPNGKVECLAHRSMGTEDNNGCKVNLENGDLGHRGDYQVLGQLDDEIPGSVLRPTEKPRILSKGQVETAVIREEEEEQAKLNFSRGPLVAPLGIPFCPASVGGARKTAPVSTSGGIISCYDRGGLYDSETLRKHMDTIATAQGLGGVSMECANVLNNMLDVYLKRLIKSCIDLVGPRSASGPARKQVVDRRSKIVNGMWPGNNLNMQSTSDPQCSVSLLDFRVAMELNPQQLGEDWPLLLERICLRSFEE